jgi:para-aminobenzoate synthetase component 1
MLRNFYHFADKWQASLCAFKLCSKIAFLLICSFLGDFSVRYIQKLPLPVPSIQHILTQLHASIGLVFLNNHDSPIIAFHPEAYAIYQHDEYRFYQRDAFTNYHLNHDYKNLNDFIQFDPTASASSDLGFQGGYIGFIGYDIAASQDVCVKHAVQPALYIGLYRTYLCQHADGWYFYSDAKQPEQHYNWLIDQLSQTPAYSIQPLRLHHSFRPRWLKSEYLHAFHKIQDYIKAGDCYQINLTQEFQTCCEGELLSKADQLWTLTNAPYAGYLKLDDFELLSCSPELFIEFEANRSLKTRPIKGTMPRYKDLEQDEKSKQQLKSSVKDQAENVMIVDLLRNDFSVHAETGSVKTTKLFEIESFNQVHHMVSEITAQLKKDANPFDVLRSALPGGSITGAPKIRAMQIIEELEQAPRGAYCGSLGYFNLDGTGSWNILIRTIQKYQDTLSVWAGGGITIASDAEAEYQECLDKVSAMLNLINTWQSHTDNYAE